MKELVTLYNLNLQLNRFKYGVPIAHKIIDLEGEEFARFYRYLSPEKFFKFRGGICWDYVSYQSYVLKEKGYEYQNFYIEVGFENPDTHTFSVIKFKEYFIYIESSFQSIKGMYIAKNINHIFDFVIFHMVRVYNGKKSYIPIKIYTYQSYEKYGASTIKFMEDMKKQPRISSKIRRIDSILKSDPSKKIYKIKSRDELYYL